MSFRDLAARMDTAVKAHVATDVAVIDGRNVQGAFSNEYVENQFIQGTRPVFRCMVADIPGAGDGSSVVYDGLSYKLRIIQPDGTGWAALILESQ